jgi:hypothetical protein
MGRSQPRRTLTKQTLNTMGRPKKQAEQIPQDDVNDALQFTDGPEISDELKTTLIKYPHINCVWMDDDGNWFFAEKPGFTPHSREQILNG